ncbi:MAG: hypothetical protein IKK14_06595 [Oscillospiraceae bacterium]|nr:hypothetical protein [Oscillospiraceae bacterium]
MKKIILLILCFVFVFSGCEKLEKAEPYYTETREDVVFGTQYEYCFTDEGSVRCFWENKSKESFYFHDVFELHVLDDDGEWYVVSKGDEVTFNTNYRHGIDPESETSSRYSISLYADELKSGKTYRISTYFYDDNGNNYQVFAEFLCDDKLAEKEMSETTDGIFNDRTDPESIEGGIFEIIDEKDN